MEWVRLKFKNVSEILGTEEIGLLILTDEQDSRQLTIPCDKTMLLQIGLRLNRVPVTNRLLPEVLWHFISMCGLTQFEVRITDIIDGEYRAQLVDLNTFDTSAIRISDAVLLSHIARIPILIEKTLMEKQSVPFNSEARGVAIPLNTVSTEMLESALQKAVEEEKYEIASHLRDELRKRKM